jgi:glycosyltransferase involved in cell wall biosynthesis
MEDNNALIDCLPIEDIPKQSRPKIAIYTMSLNEIERVDDFIESVKGADHVLVCDTGSTDGTLEALQKAEHITIQQISIKPWRFDDARNTALALLPSNIDFCWRIDLDERFSGDWDKLRDFINNTPTATRYDYYYVWNWKNDEPDISFYADNLHSREDYRWIYAAHESLNLYNKERTEIKIVIPKDICQVHQYASNRDRTLDIGPIRMAAEEYPTHQRPAFYYARELLFCGNYALAVKEFNRYLALPNITWLEEKAEAYLLIGRCYKFLGLDPIPHYKQAIETCNTRREIYWYLCSELQEIKEWGNLYDYAILGLTRCTERKYHYLERPQAWGSDLPDFAATAAFKLGKYDEAVKYGKMACDINPQDERLTNNLKFYTQGGSND